MATLSISLSGSALVTGSKTYTISDADLQRTLNWAAATFASSLPPTPTNQQILLAWVQNWINDTTRLERQFSTTPPPPISISMLPLLFAAVLAENKIVTKRSLFSFGRETEIE